MIIRIRKQGKRTSTDRKRMNHSARKSIQYLKRQVRDLDVPPDLEQQVEELQRKFATR